MIASEFTLLQRTSVVTLSICGIFKEVVTISAAGIVFHDELSVVNISGLIVTIISIASYNYLKVVKMREEAREKLRKKDEGLYEELRYDGEDDPNTEADDANAANADPAPLIGDQQSRSNGGMGSSQPSGSHLHSNSTTNGVSGSSAKRREDME